MTGSLSHSRCPSSRMQPLRGRRLISVLAMLVGALTGGVLLRWVALAAPLWLAAVLWRSGPLGGFFDSSARLDRRVASTDREQRSLGAGLARLSAVAHTGRCGCACLQISRHDYEHRILGESHREPAQYCSPCPGDHLPGGCHTRRTLLVVAVVLMASAPWVLLQPDQEVRTELDR
jgi:hypothetical protein